MSAPSRGLRHDSIEIDVGDAPPVQLDADGFVWHSPNGTVLTSGVAATVELRSGPGRIEHGAAEVQSLLRSIGGDGLDGPLACGALPFDEVSAGRVVVPEWIFRQSPDGRATVTHVAERPRPAAFRASRAGVEVPGTGRPGRFDVTPVQTREEWRAMVETARAAIAAGNADKIVLARQVRVASGRPFQRASVLSALRRQTGHSYVFGDGAFVGATPELLVRRAGDKAWSDPMAGTAPLHRLRWVDAAASVDSLERSEKDRREHQPVREHVAATLATVSSEVIVSDTEIIRLSTVAHLRTPIEARLRSLGSDAMTLAGMLHPTPAVGTSPTAALRLVRKIEPFERGRYAGPVGWVDATGDGEFAIALRCAELGNHGAELVAGAGITADSSATEEWVETESKLAVMLDALRAAV